MSKLDKSNEVINFTPLNTFFILVTKEVLKFCPKVIEVNDKQLQNMHSILTIKDVSKLVKSISLIYIKS